MSSRHFLAGRLSSALMGTVLTAMGGLSAPVQVPTSLSVMALVVAGGSFASAPASAATVAKNNIVELSPTPPNVTQAVPPNIVVTFDNSGSMASNYMGDNRPFDGGSWSGPWRCAGVIDPRVTDAKNFLSRAMNGVYYNPNVVYSPPVKADGTSFPNVDATLAAVPLDAIGVNRPYNQKTLSSTAGYNNNPNGTTDPTGATNLIGTVTLTYPKIKTLYATFGTSCPNTADAGSCSTTTSGTTGSGNPKTHVYYVNNVTGTSGSGISTVYSGTNLKTSSSSSGGYTMVTGDKTSATSKYATWTVTTTNTAGKPTLSGDNRWKCGYGSSPMDGYTTGPDGNVYPNGGPYYYRYKSTAPAITVDSYGNPDSAGQTNLYTAGNWEAVSVPNTTATINGQSVNQWQNFANWYAYYRTRNLMTRTALSRVFGSLGAATDKGGFGNSIRVAWQVLKNDDYLLPDSTIITSLLDDSGCDASTVDPLATQQQSGTVSTPPSCYRSAFFNWIFQVYGNNDTPNRAATIRAGKFFQRGNGNTGGTGDLHDPYWDPPKVSGADGLELVCRQNYHMLVTDGYWNESSNYNVTGINTATSAMKLPDGTDYSVSNAESQVYWDVQGASEYTPSLADIAFNYWATNLRPDIYDPANGKIVPPYMPDSTTGVVPGATSTALEKYFNPKNDPANWPHLVQYMVTLGVPGKLTASDDADCNDGSNDLCKLRKGQTNSSGKAGWTAPQNNDPTGIDDTWHAAVNSRGTYFNAANPQNLVDQLTNILTNITARNVPATTSALNTSVLVQGALGFSAGYSSGDWSGVFQAISANTDGTISGLQWDAAAILTDAAKTDPTKRQILSSKEKTAGGFDGGVAFKTFGDLDASGQTLLSGTPASTNTTVDTGQARLDYLRGVRTLEGTTYRTRTNLLGAIINSQAVYVSAPSSGYRNSWPTGSPEDLATANDATTCDESAPTLATCHSYEAFVSAYKDRTPAVYVGANDGMLHAFNAKMVLNTDTPPLSVPDAGAGKEMFAYVPRTVYANLGNLTAKGNVKFAPTVDATPVTRDVYFSVDTTAPATSKGWHTIMVGGLRLGGRGVYALDITDPTTVTEANAGSKVLWEFNADIPAVTGVGDPADLGYTFGQPNIGRLANGKWVVLVPGGYFPDCSKSDKPVDCATIAASSKGYSALFILDAQTGAMIRELKTLTTVAGVTSGGLSSAVLGDYNNDQVDDVAFAGDLNGNLWRFDLTDANPDNWQSHVTLAYQPATQGDQPITVMPRLFPDPATNRFIVVFGTGKYLGAADNTSDSAKTQSIYGIRDKLDSDGNPITAVGTNLQKQTLYQATSTNTTTTVRGLTNNTLTVDQDGWYIDLDLTASPGERVVVTPGALFDTNRVIVTTLIPGTQDPCSATIGGALMVMNAATGGADGGLSSPSGPTSWGTGVTGVSVVGGLVNNPPTGGSVPVATIIGGGKLLIPGLQLKGGGTLGIDDAIWRRRSWRELTNDQ